MLRLFKVPHLAAVLLAFSFAFPGLQAQATPVVSVQLFEWTWADIARECEIYLGPQGFTAVQTSPPHEHLVWGRGPWWERYQVISYKLESRSGDEKSFVEMVQRCHRAGVKVYADAVINHMAGFDNGVGSAASLFFHYLYPGIYGYTDFHHCRSEQSDIKNYSDIYELQHCELVNLADLATEKPAVQDRIAGYLNHLLDLGIDGFRVDAAKHIPPQDLEQIYSRLKRSAYVFQELIISPGEPLQYSDYSPLAAVTAYGYPYFVAKAFKEKKLIELKKITRELPASDRAVVFLNNHDLERDTNQGALLNSVKDRALFGLAQSYMMAFPYGYPHLYSGFYFTGRDDGPPLDENNRTRPILNKQGECIDPWSCAHRDPQLKAMIQFRKASLGQGLVHAWDNGQDQLAFGRGTKGFVAINLGSGEMSRKFKTSLPPGDYCNLLEPALPCNLKVDSQNNFQARIHARSGVVLLKK